MPKLRTSLHACMTPTVRDICTFAVPCSVSRPICHFTRVYEGQAVHVVL